MGSLEELKARLIQAVKNNDKKKVQSLYTQIHSEYKTDTQELIFASKRNPLEFFPLYTLPIGYEDIFFVGNHAVVVGLDINYVVETKYPFRYYQLTDKMDIKEEPSEEQPFICKVLDDRHFIMHTEDDVSEILLYDLADLKEGKLLPPLVCYQFEENSSISGVSQHEGKSYFGIDTKVFSAEGKFVHEFNVLDLVPGDIDNTRVDEVYGNYIIYEGAMKNDSRLKGYLEGKCRNMTWYKYINHIGTQRQIVSIIEEKEGKIVSEDSWDFICPTNPDLLVLYYEHTNKCEFVYKGEVVKTFTNLKGRGYPYFDGFTIVIGDNRLSAGLNSPVIEKDEDKIKALREDVIESLARRLEKNEEDMIVEEMKNVVLEDKSAKEEDTLMEGKEAKEKDTVMKDKITIVKGKRKGSTMEKQEKKERKQMINKLTDTWKYWTRYFGNGLYSIQCANYSEIDNTSFSCIFTEDGHYEKFIPHHRGKFVPGTKLLFLSCNDGLTVYV